MTKDVYYAHSDEKEDKTDWQLLMEHLENTARQAEEFAESIGLAKTEHLAGRMHDLGKYSDEFRTGVGELRRESITRR